MIRDTSIEAYNEIRNSGLLSEKRLEVYDVLYNKGPLTGGQVSRIVRGSRPSVSETIRNRITELNRLGVVKEVGTISCPVTGRRSILWDVTRNLPYKNVEIKKTKKQIVNECIKILRCAYKTSIQTEVKILIGDVAKILGEL